MPEPSEIEHIDKNTIRLKIKVTNKLGLHARPAALLVQTLAKFESDVMLSKGNQKVNAKSIMGVMMLAAGPKTVLVFDIRGSDAAHVVPAIEALFSRNFDE